MKRLIYNPVATLLLVSMIVVVGFYQWLFFFEPPWLSYKNVPFPPRQMQVQAGQPVALRVIRCNSDKFAHVYTVSRGLESLETGQFAVLPDTVVQIRPGCSDETSLANVIPPETAKGKYRIVGIAEIQATFRSIRVEWQSQPFEVI
jgi:hypothetical protein